MSNEGIHWTNRSVKRFAAGADPVATIERLARAKVLEAMDAGWSGPPFNPLEIADMLKIPVEADSEVQDARTVSSQGVIKIQFNPKQFRERLRFSIAHEIAHTLFPDVAEAPRHRGAERRGDDWQLEMLCNLAAAEFIMPLGSLPFRDSVPSIESLMSERAKFDVSAEAFLLRVARVAVEPVAVFCASPKGDSSCVDSYRIDYVVASATKTVRARAGVELPASSIVGECTAVGHTARGTVDWPSIGSLDVECVGIPAYPGDSLPRVAGIIRDKRAISPGASLQYVQGDVFKPRSGRSKQVICQLVNDRSRTWGGGVARIAAGKYPEAQAKYSLWFQSFASAERLGSAHMSDIDENRTIASLVAQHGYGPSPSPRIRYSALQKSLAVVAQEATRRQAEIRMPRIGTGEARGVWPLIEELILNELVAKGISVTVHDLPPSRLGNDANLFPS